MGSVEDLGSAFLWSISKISEAFSLHRTTVRKRLVEAGVEPAGESKGNALYALRDVGPALFSKNSETIDVEGLQNPALMPPKDRKDWYQSENERVKLEESTRQLIPEAEVVAVYSSMTKAVVQVLETIPDLLERDCALSPQAVSHVQNVIDDLRFTLAERTYHACASDLAGGEEGLGED